MSRVAFIALASVFFLKIFWNLGVPYILIARGPPPAGAPASGISIMPYEIFLVPAGVLLAFFTDFSWPWTPGAVALFGTAIFVGSYLHGILICWLAMLMMKGREKR